MEREQVYKIASLTLKAGLIAGISALAFTKDIHRQIMQRAGYASEWSGDRHMPLEASHLDHTRDNKYNTTGNGEALTIEEHLAYHTYWQKNPGYIGLDASANEWAIQKLRERVGAFFIKTGVQVANLDEYIDGRVNEIIETYTDYIDPDTTEV